MAHVVFTSHLQRFVSCPEHDVEAGTVRAALARIFVDNPRLRDYILDDQGGLRNREERKEWFGGGADAPGIHSILLDKRNITVGISCGGVWKSADGGDSWELAGVRCAAKPEVMWTQHHNGIFRSNDAGRTWAAINDSFGFAVAVHPRDANTAWFVPAIKDELRYPASGKLAVTRTRDGGKSFQTLREGLPQEHAYDLIYRHGLDVDASGERLAMGSTTGGLWVSMNGGDSWRGISARLPPIYCLRFS